MAVELVSGSRAVEEMVAGGKGVTVDPARPTVFLCLFGYGGLESHLVKCLLQEMRLFDKAEVNFALHTVHGDALISRSRSKAFSVFMDAEMFDVCIMLDHDIQWQPGALLGLAMKVKAVQACVAGVYPCRGVGTGVSSRIEDEVVRFKPGDDKLFPARYLATGFLGIPRVVGQEVLEAGKRAAARLHDVDLGDFGNAAAPTANPALHECVYNDGSPFFDYFRPIVVPRLETDVVKAGTEVKYEYLSEDWAFSWRCKQAAPQRPLYAWALPYLVHHGSYGYTIQTAYANRDGGKK